MLGNLLAILENDKTVFLAKPQNKSIRHIFDWELFSSGGENGQLILDFSVRFNSLQITKHKSAKDKMDLNGIRVHLFFSVFVIVLTSYRLIIHHAARREIWMERYAWFIKKKGIIVLIKWQDFYFPC